MQSSTNAIAAAKSGGLGSPNEVLNVVASRPVQLVVIDDQGRQTGRISADEITYDIPDIGFSMSELSGAVSLASSQPYDISVTAQSDGPTTVRAVRIRDDGTERRTILYADTDWLQAASCS